MGMSLDEIKELNAYHLSGMADCASPDSLTSAGALMLESIRNSIVENIEGGYITLDNLNDSGQLHEIADNAPSVYTHPKWLQFVDLGAYTEEPESGEWPRDLDKAASVALYQIADRLAHLLAQEWQHGWECDGCGREGEDAADCVDRCAYADEEEEEEVPAEAILTGPVDLPADPFRGHPDYAGEGWQRDHGVTVEPVTEPIRDPLLDIIEVHERQARQLPGDETAAFMAKMEEINAAEFTKVRPWGHWANCAMLAGVTVALVVAWIIL